MDGEKLDNKNWPRRVTQSLLKILASERGKIHSQDQLIDLLFPDSGYDAAKRNLYNRVSELRKLLEPNLKSGRDSQYILRVGPGNYAFSEVAQVELDVELYSQNLEQARNAHSNESWSQAQEAFECAEALFTGPYLAEDPYEEWALDKRSQLEEARLQALLQWAECNSTLGDLDQAIELCQKVLEADSTREAAYRQLMLAHYHKGEQSKALEVYKNCIELLERNLGVRPDPVTLELAKQIEKREISQLERAIPHNLPKPITDFIGREKLLEQIEQQLASDRLVTLVGVGGGGKTRLATEIGHSVLSKFKDGVWFIDLASIGDSELIYQAIASPFSIQESSAQDLEQAVIDSFKSKELLLIFDNCEHILGESASAADKLLSGCEDLRILATSRERMAITGEIGIYIPPLEIPAEVEHLTSEELREFESVQLFVERSKRANPDFAMSEHNSGAIATICRQLDGIPLVLELAAARMRMMDAHQLSERLERRLDILTGGSRTAEPRQQTLQATIEWSYDLLDEREQALLRSLSIFAGSFSIDEVEEICTTSELDKNDVLDLVTNLVDKSLITFSTQSDEGRYRMLESIRAFGKSRLQAHEEEAHFRIRQLEYFSDFAETAKEHYSGPEQADWLNRVEVEHDNIRGALRWAVSSDESGPGLGLRLSAGLWPFWSTRGYWTEGRNWFEEILPLAENDSTTAERAEALLGDGVLAHNQGNYAEAQSLLESSLENFEELDELHGKAMALKWLGTNYARSARFDEAISACNKSRILYSEIGDKYAEASLLANIGGVYQYQESLEEALIHYEQASQLFEEIGDHIDFAKCLSNMGLTYVTLGQFERALYCHQRALPIKQGIGDQKSHADSLLHLGIAQESNSARVNPRLSIQPFKEYLKFHEAVDSHKQALSLYKQIGDKSGKSAAFYNLGSVHLCIGTADIALDNFNRALQVSRELSLHARIVRTLSGMSRAYLQAEMTVAALESSSEAISLLTDGSIPQQEEIQYSHALALEANDRIDESLKFVALAQDAVQSRADRLKDPNLKESYLHANRSIISKWEESQSS